MKNLNITLVMFCLLFSSTELRANDCSQIFVSNLASNTSEDEIYELFLEQGSIGKINFIADKETGRFRGLAFVKMENCQAAQDAINALNGADFNGLKMRVTLAQPNGQ